MKTAQKITARFSIGRIVRLRIKNPDSPLLVLPNNGGAYSDAEKFVCADARGVIMPIKLPTA